MTTIAFNITVESIIPIPDLLPTLTQSNETRYTYNGINFNKSRAIRIAVMANSFVCSLCNKPATHFSHIRSASGLNIIRLMFSHNDHLGRSAFMTVDHIVPKSIGGVKVQLACNVCNSKKANSLDIAIKMGEPIPVYDHSYNTLIYTAYIRWYLQMFYTHTTIKGWCVVETQAYRCIARMIQKTGEFDVIAYTQAKNSISKYLRTTKYEKGTKGPKISNQLLIQPI